MAITIDKNKIMGAEAGEQLLKDVTETLNAQDEAVAEAKASSASAIEAAAAAKTIAEGIEAKVDSAIETATTASNTAAAAKTIAEGIEAKADSAIETATTASNTAAEAKTTADEAAETADTASETATAAKTAADTASETATSAKTTADTATETATEAKTAADEAKTTATAAKTAADTASETADEAKTAAENADSNAQHAIEVADSVKTALDELDSVPGDFTVPGNLNVAGDIVKNDEVSLDTTADMMVLRKNKTTGLAAGELSGFVAHNTTAGFDSTAAFDKDGTFRIKSDVNEHYDYAGICRHGTGVYKDFISGNEVAVHAGTVTAEESCSVANTVWYEDTNTYYRLVTDAEGNTSWYKQVVDASTELLADYAEAETDADILAALDELKLRDLKTLWYWKSMHVLFVTDNGKQPVMTRSETADLSDGQLLRWDAEAKKAVPVPLPTVNGQVLTATVPTTGAPSYAWKTVEIPEIIEVSSIGDLTAVPDNCEVLVTANIPVPDIYALNDNHENDQEDTSCVIPAGTRLTFRNGKAEYVLEELITYDRPAVTCSTGEQFKKLYDCTAATGQTFDVRYPVFIKNGKAYFNGTVQVGAEYIVDSLYAVWYALKYVQYIHDVLIYMSGGIAVSLKNQELDDTGITAEGQVLRATLGSAMIYKEPSNAGNANTMLMFIRAKFNNYISCLQYATVGHVGSSCSTHFNEMDPETGGFRTAALNLTANT